MTMTVNINPLLQKIGTRLDEAVKKHADDPTTYGDRQTSLLYVQGHDNCEEMVKTAEAMGVEMVAFPKMTPLNCEVYDEAKAVIDRGLSPSLALCPTCPHRIGCPYRSDLARAFRAQHAVATQQRGVYAREEYTQNRNRITIDENPLNMLRPTFAINNGLLMVAWVAHWAVRESNTPEDRRFYERMSKIARWLDRKLMKATKPEELPLPKPPKHVPANVHDMLNTCIIKWGVEKDRTPPPNTLKVVLATALGELDGLFVSVNDVPACRDEEGKVKHKKSKSMVGVMTMQLDPDVELWINDATTTKEEVEAATGMPVEDVGPRGRLILQHPVTQVIQPRDITKRTDPKRVIPILRGILHDLPQQRVGLLTHQHLAVALPKMLGEEDQARLTMVGWFGGVLTRGSNQWIAKCDALVILGTPRLKPADVRMRLIVLGKIRAAKMEQKDAGWGTGWWLGTTETGKKRAVKWQTYSDHDWHAAYCSLTRSELIQAIGRGRGILPEGIPVIVVTNEFLAPAEDGLDGRNGYPLADEGRFIPLSESQVRVLGCIDSKTTKTAAEIAEQLRLTPKRVKQILAELEGAGRVWSKKSPVRTGPGQPPVVWRLRIREGE
jgi:hypothetical protein